MPPRDNTPEMDEKNPDAVADEHVSVDLSERETQKEAEAAKRAEAAERGEGLQRPVLHNRETFPAGTDPKDLGELTDEERERLERIGALPEKSSGRAKKSD